MTVELFCLCDYAAADSGGKLTIVGAFDSLRVAAFPATHPLCAIAAKLRFQAAEAGRRRFGIRILDPEGQPAMTPVEGEIEVAPAPDQAAASVQLTVTISQLRLMSPGPYSIQLEVDSKPAASIPLYVKPAELPIPTGA